MLPDNLSTHRMCRLAWNGVGLTDGTGWEKVIFPTETCLHVNTVSEEDIPMGMTHLMSVFLWGKTCYPFYLFKFCSKMLSVLRSHLSFFAFHRGSVIPEVSKVISYYFFFSNLIKAKTPFWLDFTYEVLQLKPQATRKHIRTLTQLQSAALPYSASLLHTGHLPLPWVKCWHVYPPTSSVSHMHL